MDELENMGPVLLPEEEAKLAKAKLREQKFNVLRAHKKRTLYIICSVFGAVLLLVIGIKVSNQISKPINASKIKPVDSITNDTQITQSKTIGGLQLNSRIKYGNKYASGVLPVGDKQYVTDAPKKGYIYLCSANFVPEGQAGAQTRGPWFINNNTQWDMNKKPAIAGSIDWTPKMTNKVENGKRIITTNNLPNHHTGVFPVASNDPARKYDANPNTISEQSLTYELSAGPGQLSSPACMGGEVGVMLTGAALFNAFDAGGRDAGAWEVQDTCDGHPQVSGEYHYHTLSRCITEASVKDVIGYALDGYPITGPKVADDSILTTENLDECHGLVSEVMVDGKKLTTYHYVMTQDFPYSVSCFKGKAIQPPGKHEAENAGPPPRQQRP